MITDGKNWYYLALKSLSALFIGVSSNKIIKYNYGEKSLKAPFIIYADLECLLEEMHLCQNNFERSYTEKATKHMLSGYSIFTSSSFDPTKNKFDCYKGEDCMENICKDLREHAMKIMNYEKKE